MRFEYIFHRFHVVVYQIHHFPSFSRIYSSIFAHLRPLSIIFMHLFHHSWSFWSFSISSTYVGKTHPYTEGVVRVIPDSAPPRSGKPAVTWGVWEGEILEKQGLVGIVTLPETNIAAPENWWLEDYFPCWKAYFQGLRLF